LRTLKNLFVAALACCGFVFSAHAERYTATSIAALNRILKSSASSMVGRDGSANGSDYLKDGDNIEIRASFALTESLTIN